MNIEDFEKCGQLNENEQKLNKRKNTEEHVCVLLGTQIKCNKHTNLFVIEYNQYFISNKELWTNNLIKLKSLIDLNERLPNKSVEIENELTEWLDTQLINRKADKNIMLNEDIKGLWNSFIKDYEQYFI